MSAWRDQMIVNLLNLRSTEISAKEPASLLIIGLMDVLDDGQVKLRIASLGGRGG